LYIEFGDTDQGPMKAKRIKDDYTND